MKRVELTEAEREAFYVGSVRGEMIPVIEAIIAARLESVERQRDIYRERRTFWIRVAQGLGARAVRPETALADLRAGIEALADSLGPWEEASADEIRALLAEGGA